MVSGEYCTFSAFSTMVSRLALDHLDHYLNNRHVESYSRFVKYARARGNKERKLFIAVQAL